MVIKKLKAAETAGLLAAIVNSSFEAIVSTTLDGTVTSWNPAATRLFGFLSDEIVGQTIRRLIPLDRQDEEDLILERIEAGECIKPYMTVRLHKDGPPREVLVTISPVLDAAERIIGVSTIARAFGDLTGRFEAEQALRESREHLDRAQAVARTGSWRLDVHHNKLMWSAETYRMFG